MDRDRKRLMGWAVLAMLTCAAAVLLQLGGCVSYVSHADRATITSNALNAAEFDKRIQAAPAAESDDAPLPAWVKGWSAEDRRAWAAMHAWAKREQPAPTTQPATRLVERPADVDEKAGEK